MTTKGSKSSLLDTKSIASYPKFVEETRHEISIDAMA